MFPIQVPFLLWRTGAVKHLSINIPEDPKNSTFSWRKQPDFYNRQCCTQKSTVTNGRNFASRRQNKRAIQSPLSVEGKEMLLGGTMRLEIWSVHCGRDLGWLYSIIWVITLACTSLCNCHLFLVQSNMRQKYNKIGREITPSASLICTHKAECASCTAKMSWTEWLTYRDRCLGNGLHFAGGPGQDGI